MQSHLFAPRCHDKRPRRRTIPLQTTDTTNQLHQHLVLSQIRPTHTPIPRSHSAIADSRWLPTPTAPASLYTSSSAWVRSPASAASRTTPTHTLRRRHARKRKSAELHARDKPQKPHSVHHSLAHRSTRRLCPYGCSNLLLNLGRHQRRIPLLLDRHRSQQRRSTLRSQTASQGQQAAQDLTEYNSGRSDPARHLTCRTHSTTSRRLVTSNLTHGN
jgi:hypothetical protein